jgi:hypothetical protein
LQVGAHANTDSLGREIVKWDKIAIAEAEKTDYEEEELYLLQRFGELSGSDFVRTGVLEGTQSQVGDYEEEEH